MANTKPYVQVACLCEKVLRDRDDVASLIRIVDTYTVNFPENVGLRAALTAFISLKSGDLKGAYKVGLVLVDPEDKRAPLQTWDVVLEGGVHGTNVQVNFMIDQPKTGTYGFEVMWGDEVLTRIPFRLRKKEVVAPT